MLRTHSVFDVSLTPADARAVFLLAQASDQYLLEGLKRLCEMTIAQSLTPESVVATFELSEAYSAPQLGKCCVLFALEHYDELVRTVSRETPAVWGASDTCFRQSSITVGLARSAQQARLLSSLYDPVLRTLIRGAPLRTLHLQQLLLRRTSSGCCPLLPAAAAGAHDVQRNDAAYGAPAAHVAAGGRQQGSSRWL